jgi:hypothetical protein
VRAGRGTAVGVVTELVDVEATLGVGVVTGDVPGDGGGRVLVGLLEGDSAGDLGVSAEDSDWRKNVSSRTLLLWNHGCKWSFYERWKPMRIKEHRKYRRASMIRKAIQ